MPIDKVSFFQEVEDPRYDSLKMPVKVDKSNRATEIMFINPATNKSSFTLAYGPNYPPTQWSCWNADGTTHYFDVYAGPDYKAVLQSCYIQISYYPVQVRNSDAVAAFAGCPIACTGNQGARKGFGISWNSIYNFFQTISLKGNQSQTAIESYVNNNNLGHISTLRYLLKYKRSALENNDQELFTPCIESTFDTDSLSEETFLRSNRWMAGVGISTSVYSDLANVTNNQPKKYTKLISLASIFEFCENPGILQNLNRFRVEFTMRSPDKIAFLGFNNNQLPAHCSMVHIFVDDIQLIYDACRMTSIRSIETATNKQQGSVENIAYCQNEVIPWNFSGGSQVVCTSQRDVQLCAFAVPAYAQHPVLPNGTTSATTCLNPIQYHNAGITSMNLIYGSDMPLRQPLRLSDGALVGGSNLSPSFYSNAIAYEMYKKSACCDRAMMVPPALSYTTFPMYNFFCFPIFNQSFIHKTNDPRDLRFDNNTSTPIVNVPSVIIVRKFAGLQVDSLGGIEKV